MIYFGIKKIIIFLFIKIRNNFYRSIKKTDIITDN
jgi:hypothetical protein